MKRILFVYPEVMIGGSTTSLLSLLRVFDYNRYEVDLLLYKNVGELIEFVPNNVNILAEAAVDTKVKSKLIFPNYIMSRIKTLRYKGKINHSIAYSQIMSYAKASQLSRKINKEYDVAISFLELWSNAYVINNVKAKRKIGWIHPDYIGAGFVPKVDCKAFRKLDSIVVVSDKCRNSFVKCFPELSFKVVCINNILSSEYIHNLADKEIQFRNSDNGLCIITVCRLTNLSKGLDRGVSALSRLKDEGYKFDWFIVGDGPDRNELEQQIYANSSTDCIHLLGKMSNPYPYIKQADLFFLPSRYEGKPMAITEAQMLNVPAIVTEYSSAREQVKDGVEGIITANSDVAIYEGLKYVFDNPQLLSQFKFNLTQTDKSNLFEIEKIYDLIDRRSE